MERVLCHMSLSYCLEASNWCSLVSDFAFASFLLFIMAFDGLENDDGKSAKNPFMTLTCSRKGADNSIAENTKHL